jgi:hypothetical protein
MVTVDDVRRVALAQARVGDPGRLIGQHPNLRKPVRRYLGPIPARKWVEVAGQVIDQRRWHPGTAPYRAFALPEGSDR